MTPTIKPTSSVFCPILRTGMRNGHVETVIQRKKEFISELLSCSPREHSMICNILIISNHRPNEQQKYKQSKPIMDFSSSEYDTVQFSIKYLPGLLVSVQ